MASSSQQLQQVNAHHNMLFGRYRHRYLMLMAIGFRILRVCSPKAKAPCFDRVTWVHQSGRQVCVTHLINFSKSCKPFQAFCHTTHNQLLPGNIPTVPGLMRLQTTAISSKWHWLFPALAPVHGVQTGVPLFLISSMCQP